MQAMRLIIIMTVLTSRAALGQTQITYSLETGGNNYALAWEDNQNPIFTPGTNDGSTTVEQGDDLTWAVRVAVSGSHSEPGLNGSPLGAANLVFDLSLLEQDGSTPVNVGAAVLACETGEPGQTGALHCRPVTGGFWSSINDGDADGTRGQTDLLTNAAFASSIYNGILDTDPNSQMYGWIIKPYPDNQQGDPPLPSPPPLHRLIDPIVPNEDITDTNTSGPNFDYGWYPTANGRSGIDLRGTRTPDDSVNSPSLVGKLMGFGAGYLSYEYAHYRPGVGIFDLSYLYYGFGNESDPQPPLFEGQISTIGMASGTYILKITPSEKGSTVLQAGVSWYVESPAYGRYYTTFATRAGQVAGIPADGLTFTVTPATQIVARKLFYDGSYYDGAPPTRDDANAIDPTKTPLMPGEGQATFSSWTGFTQGITGLIYDVADKKATPQDTDFVFHDIGKAGTLDPGTIVTPATFIVQEGAGQNGTTRVIITFAAETVMNTWLRVDVGTNFGLRASETHYWGNAAGDGGIGNAGVNIIVGVTDELAARNNPHNATNRALVDDLYDYNKDSFVDGTDQLYPRNHLTNAFTCVNTITR